MTAGILILVTLVWDGVSDPLVGYIVDRYSLFFGSYARILVISVPFTAITFTATLWLPYLFNGSIAFAILLAGILFRLGYTFVDIAHNSLLANLTSDHHERTSLSVYRFLFSSMGTLLLLWLVTPLLEDARSPELFVMLSITISLFYLLRGNAGLY